MVAIFLEVKMNKLFQFLSGQFQFVCIIKILLSCSSIINFYFITLYYIALIKNYRIRILGFEN